MSKELDDINYIKRKRDIELDRFVSKTYEGKAPLIIEEEIEKDMVIKQK